MADGIKLATAYVEVTADTSKIKSALSDVGKSGTSTGQTVGANMADAMATHLASAKAQGKIENSLKYISRHGTPTGKDFAANMAKSMNLDLGSHGRKAGATFSTGLKSGINEGVRGLASSFGPLSGAVESVFSGLSSKAGLAALGVAGIGAAAAVVGKQLYDLGAQWDSISDGIAVRTGKLGDDLKAITDSVKNVGPDTAAGLGEIGDVAGRVTQSLHLTGKPLERMVENIATLNEMTGENLNIRDLGKVLRVFKVDAEKNGVDVLNQLTNASQNTGVPINELIAALVKAGPVARDFKLNIGQTAAVMATFEGAGLSIDTVKQALSRFAATAAKDGKDVRAELEATITQIQTLPEEAARQLASQAFGAKNFEPIFQAIRDGTIDVDSLNTSLGKTGPTIEEMRDATSDWNEEFQKLKNTMELGVLPAATKMFEGINALADFSMKYGPLRLWMGIFEGLAAFDKKPIPPYVPGPSVPGVTPGPGSAGGAAVGPPGGGTAAGQNPLSVFAPTGGSARDFAHNTALPFWQSQGFQVGDHAADQYGEHQNGAIDVMVPNIAAGQGVLQRALSDPNAYGVIFNGQTYGYGQGKAPRPYTGPNPHTDHVHILYKPQGYDQGGWLPPGTTVAQNNTGKPELILSGQKITDPDQLKYLYMHLGMVGAGSDLNSSRTGARTGQFNPNMLLDTSRTSVAYPFTDKNGWFQLQRKLKSEMRNRGERSWWGNVAGAWTTPVGGVRSGIPWPDSDPFSNRLDQGGMLPPGYSWVLNATGQPELVLNPDQAAAVTSAVDPNTTQHGQAQGAPPGPQQLADMATEMGRTQGAIPAAAGFTGKTGGGIAGSLLDVGAEAINGAIQMGADAAKAAASAAAAGGSFGAAGGAGGELAGIGIQMGADAAKRGVKYGAELAGIGIGAATEILSPFGAPRWLSDVDPMSFVPQTGLMGAAVTTAEKAVLAQQGIPVDPNTTIHGQGMGQPPGPQPPAAAVSPATAPNVQMTVEPIPPPQPNGQPAVHIENMYAQDSDAAARAIADRQRLAALQYQGRP